MADRITVSAWPSVPDCLSWSDDSELAIAAGEVVEILLPRLSFGKREKELEETHWSRVRVQINLFNELELPFFEPLGFTTFSIGEEQSQGTVKTLAWSATGLAKHRRCALAVLGTNHVLSLWASASDPKETKSWHRVLLINRCLSHYFEEAQNTRDTSAMMNSEQILRLRSRVRAFSWCPKPSCSALSESSLKSVLYQRGNLQLLAVTNDFNEIIIFEISAPYHEMGHPPTSWNARVLNVVNLGNGIDSDNLSPYSLPGLSPLRQLTSQITCSRWTQAPGDARDTMRSTMAYVIEGVLKLKHYYLSFSTGGLAMRAHEKDHTLAGEHTGPLKWLLQGSDPYESLLSVTQNDLVCIELWPMIGPPASPGLRVKHHQISHKWHSLGGTALTAVSTGGSELHFATHTVHNNECGNQIGWPLNDQPTVRSSDWNVSIVKHRTDFSAEHKLAGHVTTQLWGLASSPFGDCLAACYSLLPKDMLLYAMSVDQNSSIVISDEVTDLPSFENTSHQLDMSFESILFSITRWNRRNNINVRPDQRTMDVIWQWLDTMSSGCALVTPSIDDIQVSKSVLEVLVRLRAYMSTYRTFTTLVRFEMLGAQDEVHSLHGSNNTDSVTWRLCTAVVNIPTGLYVHTPCSEKVLCTYKYWRSCLAKEHPEQYPHIENTFSNSLVADKSEQCTICDGVIDFEDSQWACCGNGHQFVRCGLTLLAIQAPGISKSCGLCNRLYLTDQYLAAIDENDTNHLETAPHMEISEFQNVEYGIDNSKKPASLVQLLFDAFDVCIYCGGKFIG